MNDEQIKALVKKRRLELRRYKHLIQNFDSPKWKKPTTKYRTDPTPSPEFRTAVKGKERRTSGSKPPRSL